MTREDLVEFAKHLKVDLEPENEVLIESLYELRLQLSKTQEQVATAKNHVPYSYLKEFVGLYKGIVDCYERVESVLPEAAMLPAIESSFSLVTRPTVVNEDGSIDF